MAHPMQEHRSHKHMKDRVSHIAGEHMRHESGANHSDVKEDKALIRKMVKGTALRADGGAVKARADKVARAKGGRVKGTTVNVIVAPKGQDMPAAPAMAAPPLMPPRPPVMPPAPVQAGPTGLGGMPPPPIRSDGGRAYKKGGAVKGKMSGEKKHGKKGKPFKMKADGGSVPMPRPRPEGREPQPKDLYSEGDAKRVERGRWKGGAVSDSSKGGTQIQHSGNKSDTQNIGRGKPITYAAGGAIYADGKKGKQMAWLKGVGAGGGEGRLKKAHHDKKAGHEPWTNDPGTSGRR